MDMNNWTKYSNQSEFGIAQDLIQEEIDNQTRYREQTSFRCVARTRIKNALLWMIPTLLLLVKYVVTNPLDRDHSGVVPVLLAALVWLVQACMISDKKAAKYLARMAVKSPETPFSQLVAEDIAEDKANVLGSRMFHVLLCLAIMAGSLSVTIHDRLIEIHVDGMIFKPYRDGCILVDCERDFRTAHVVIPEQADGETVIAIDSGAFMEEKDIVSVSIPDTVTELGAEAFSGCIRLESIVIPEGITAIRGNCFENCIRLTDVTLHDGITAIHGYAFRNCSSLEQITLPKGITEIRGSCFEQCFSLTSIEIPQGVTRIGGHAFMGCRKLEYVYVPYTVTEIGSSAFRECSSLESIEIPEDCQVDVRSFKNSPTAVERGGCFTEEEREAIIREAEAKDTDVFYFVYDKDTGVDKACFPEAEGCVIIVDSEVFSENLSSGMALQPLNDAAEVIDYLERMKEQGAETVEWCILSPTASELRGENWFIGGYDTIDGMILQMEAKLEES